MKNAISENIDSHENNQIYNLLNKRYLMILAIVGASILSGCAPEMTKHQIRVRQETSKRCNDCLENVSGWSMDEYECLKKQMVLAVNGKTASAEKCTIPPAKRKFEEYDCDNLCEDLDYTKEKCNFKIMKYALEKLRRMKERLKCLIHQYKGKRVFKKCKLKSTPMPQDLIKECGNKK